MILRGLALDYDGTLATADHIPPPALEGLRRAREAGLTLGPRAARWTTSGPSCAS